MKSLFCFLSVNKFKSPKVLENIASTYHASYHDRFSHLLTVYFSNKMALEKTIKDLQSHNAQFQQMFLNLAKGQEDLKALFTKGS